MKRLFKTSILALTLCLLTCAAVHWTTQPRSVTAAYAPREDPAALGVGWVHGDAAGAGPSRSVVAPVRTGAGSSASVFRFRGVTWGDSLGVVRATETREVLAEDGEALVVRDRLGDLPCTLSYRFAEGRLVGATYVIAQRHTDKFYHISDYGSLNTLLTQKYGQPTYDRVVWKDDRLKDDPGRWGEALGLGQLVLSAGWEAPATEVALRFERYADELRLLIEYRSMGHTRAGVGDASEDPLRDL
ncbi:MAG: hypothetical protein ACYTGQ_12350 [Planctomycetota bacterium]|jgi:hypothetical protein